MFGSLIIFIDEFFFILFFKTKQKENGRILLYYNIIILLYIIIYISYKNVKSTCCCVFLLLAASIQYFSSKFSKKGNDNFWSLLLRLPMMMMDILVEKHKIFYFMTHNECLWCHRCWSFANKANSEWSFFSFMKLLLIYDLMNDKHMYISMGLDLSLVVFFIHSLSQSKKSSYRSRSIHGEYWCPNMCVFVCVCFSGFSTYVNKTSKWWEENKLSHYI